MHRACRLESQVIIMIIICELKDVGNEHRKYTVYNVNCEVKVHDTHFEP